MIDLAEAQAIIQNQRLQQRAISKKLSEARGFHSAAPITAPFDVPGHDNSAMDGYAVCGVHQQYTIIGEVPAGHVAEQSLSNGEAMRIFTGAPVPDGTTAVVMQEHAEQNDQRLTIDENLSIKAGQHVRPRGGELKKGASVFEKGQPLNPASIGMLASVGITEVSVVAKPSVSIITTGDELVPPGSERAAGQQFESNSAMLRAALCEYGFTCAESNHFTDNFDAIKDGINQHIRVHNVVLLSGGISVGDYDFVKRALQELNVETLFYKVYQKPGKPLYFGKKNDTFVFALPGNPASSLSCFYVHVLPLLQRMSGNRLPGLQEVQLPLGHEYKNTIDRPVFLKARLHNSNVSILDKQSSSMIYSMARGNAIVFLAEPASLSEGELVKTFVL